MPHGSRPRPNDTTSPKDEPSEGETTPAADGMGIDRSSVSKGDAAQAPNETKGKAASAADLYCYAASNSEAAQVALKQEKWHQRQISIVQQF